MDFLSSGLPVCTCIFQHTTPDPALDIT